MNGPLKLLRYAEYLHLITHCEVMNGQPNYYVSDLPIAGVGSILANQLEYIVEVLTSRSK